MGDLIQADFRTKLTLQLKRFDPNDTREEYQAEIFKELYSGFPQFQAHVAAYVERHYCMVLNDEDHHEPEAVLNILSPEEVLMQNQWIVNRNRGYSIQHRTG